MNPRLEAQAAAEAASIEVRDLHDLSELDDARRVFDEVWPSADGSTQVPPNLLKAIVHAGGHASAAYRDGDVVGATFAFVGYHPGGDGRPEPHLHSHMAAVREGHRDARIGTAMKLHQRAWALEHQVPVLVWTFDPLVRRNAVLNLVRLGATVSGFEPNFYGDMDDAINAGDPTDRLFAWWQLSSERAERAARGELALMDPPTLLAARRDIAVVPVPEDIVELRSRDPEEAQQWRLQTRERIQTALADGYRIIGMSNDGYVLEK
jgi:hypothetical protein